MCDCNKAATVVWRVERKGEPAREFATQDDAMKWDASKGGGGDVFPVTR